VRDRFAVVVIIILILFGFYTFYMAGVQAGKQHAIVKTVIEKQTIIIPVEVELFDGYKEIGVDSITVDCAIDLLYGALKIHQRFVDNPENCNDIVGNPEWHLRWVKVYESVISLIRKLE